MYNITSSAPPSIKELSPDIPDRLVPILEKLLAKDMEARYQTGKELVDDLLVCLNKEA
jgi:serine/threonine-protein kinase